MARKQIPNLGSPEPLATPAPVTDFYAPPPKPAADNNAAQLVSALSSFNSALGQFGAASAIANRKSQAEIDQAAANKWIMGHTNDEIKDAVRTGKAPYYMDPAANGAIAKGYAGILGNEIKNNLVNGINSGHINLLDPKFDPDQFITQQAQGAIADITQRYPDAHREKFATAGLSATLSSLRPWLIAQREAALTKQNLHERLGTVNTALDGIIKSAQGGEEFGTVTTPEQNAQANIRKAYGELGKTFDLPPWAIDQQLIGVLKNNAKQYPKRVLHILTADRTDQNGNKLPALINNGKYQTDAREILTTVQGALAKQFDAQKKQDFTNELVTSLARADGGVLSRHDVSYVNPITKEQHTLTANDHMKDALAIYQTNSDTQARQRFESPDAQFERDYPVYHQANLPGPWQKALEAAPSIVTNPAALTNQDSRKQGIDAGELYMKLGAKDYNYLQSTTKLDQRSKDFYNTYEVARRYMGKNQDEALDTAAAVVNTPGGTSPGGVDRASIQKKLEQKIDSDFSSPDTHFYNPLSWFIHSAGAGNKGQIRQQVTAMARVIARVDGVKPEDAVTYAEQYAKDHATIINGHAILDQGYMPPKELQQYVPQALKQFVAQHGDYVGVKDASNLTVTPTGNAGIYRITDRSHPMARPLFVLNKNGDVSPAVISTETLKGLRDYNIKSVEDKNTKEALDTFEQQPVREQQRKDAQILRTPRGALTVEQQQRQSDIAAKNRDAFLKSMSFGLNSMVVKAPAPDLAGSDALQKSFGDLSDKIGKWFGRINERSFKIDLSKNRIKNNNR